MRGRVAAGRGDLAQWMTRYSEAYERAAGVRPEPGSLNIVLDEPWVMEHPAVRLEASEVGVEMGLVSAVSTIGAAGSSEPTGTTPA